MSKKKIIIAGIVYSTNPDFQPEYEKDIKAKTLESAFQKLRIRLDTKQRAGKAVTLVQGFIGDPADLESLGKRLKTACGTGGSTKEGEILIQGDNREKVFQWLIKNGFTSTKKF